MVQPESLNDWLSSFGDASSPRGASKLRDALMRNPSQASYASISDVSRMAELNMAAVTRISQSWGFSGWPDLRVELRSRYLRSLSLSEVATERRVRSSTDPAESSLDADRRALMTTSTALDSSRLRTVAEAAASASKRISLGFGSYKVLADLTATYFTLSGFPTISPVDPGGLANTLVDIGEGDFVIGFDLWRGYRSTLSALTYAGEQGAVCCLVTDRGPRAADGAVDHVFTISSEGSNFYPTLVPAVAFVNALSAELVAIDPTATESSSKRYEEIWRRMGFDTQA